MGGCAGVTPQERVPVGHAGALWGDHLRGGLHEDVGAWHRRLAVVGGGIVGFVGLVVLAMATGGHHGAADGGGHGAADGADADAVPQPVKPCEALGAHQWAGIGNHAPL